MARVNVTLKDDVLDPQGKAVMHGLHDLGFKTVQDVRVGKLIELKVEAANSEEAKTRAAEMAQKLLANPVIEKFTVTVENLS